MKVVSLFSGCGGLDFGFKKEGYDINFANDFLDDACHTYEENIGSEISNQDINSVRTIDIPYSDIVIGGPPCQGFSGAGKRDPNDERSSLVWKFVDIVESKNPSIFIFENVVGLKSSKDIYGNLVINQLKNIFNKIGYNVEISTLNAANYGVPQKRKRVFIVGNNKNLKIGIPQITHFDESIQQANLFDYDLSNWVSADNAIGDLAPPSKSGIVNYVKDINNDFLKFVRDKNDSHTNLHIIPYASDREKKIIPHIKPGSNYMDIPQEYATDRIKFLQSNGGRTTVYGRLHPNKPSYTLNTWFDRPNVGSNIHYKDDRMITIREGLRIQSFPDNFKVISKNKRNYYLQVGNAVPPLLSSAWAKHLKTFL